MNEYNNEISYSDLEYGGYIIREDTVFTEATRYSAAEYNRLYRQKVRLPDGKENIIYLLTEKFEDVGKIINGGNFIIPQTYRKVFFPLISSGTFMGRYFYMTAVDKKTSRIKTIRSELKKIPLALKKLGAGDPSSLFYVTSDIYQTAMPIMRKFPIKKVYTEFLSEFMRLVRSHLPAGNSKGENRESGHRILLIDAESFAFKPNGSIKENCTNPLFLIYLAFFRNRNFAEIAPDQDIMIIGKNMFMKFNPGKLTGKDFTRFKNMLFKIMRLNLDDYVAEIPKEELDISEDEQKISKAVTKVVGARTKFNNEDTKSAVANVVTDKMGHIVSRRSKKTTGAKIEAYKAAKVKSVDPYKQQRLFDKVIGNKYEPLVVDTNQMVEPEEQAADKKIAQQKPATTADEKQAALFKQLVGRYDPFAVTTGTEIDNDELDDIVDTDEVESEIPEDERIANDVDEVLNDEEVKETILDTIQEETVPLNNNRTSPVNTELDKKLREKQKKVVVKDSTIDEILNKEAVNVPLETEDKSAVMKTTNENMKQIKFTNFEKTYLESLFVKDLVACFNSLADKPNPLYVRAIDVQDTSTITDLKETWTVKLVNELGTNYTLKVDIPKFYQNKFMLLGGNRYIIMKQNFHNPVIKDARNMVDVTTSTNKKVIMWRKATKSFIGIEKLFSTMRKANDDKTFVPGNASKINAKYISSLEFDEISEQMTQFKTKTCKLYFDRKYIADEVLPLCTETIKGDEFLIGYENKQPVIINSDTGRDRNGRTIINIIEDNLPEEYKKIFNAAKGSANPMYAECKISGLALPVGVVLVVWLGLTELLKRMDIQWTFYPGKARIQQKPNFAYMKFADGTLEYQAEVFAQLILNGLNPMKPAKFNFNDFNSEKGYYEYLYAKSGRYGFASVLKNHYDFMMDPIVKEICASMMLPTEGDLLIIYAVKLLCSNEKQAKPSDKLCRVRSIEIIPSILYAELQNQHAKYVSSGYKQPMTLPINAVIKTLQMQKTVKESPVLNPAIEVGEANTIQSRGFGGTNLDGSYDEERRSYDPSSIGKIAISSSPDANVGISRELVVEPTITNARGQRDDSDNTDELSDVNIFSPVEMLTPGTPNVDDSIRVAIADKQSKHLVPTVGAVPALVSNGYDEAIQFHLSDSFVINAEEDGKVVEVNEEVGMIVVEYKSGKHKAFSTKPEIVKNSNGGFYMNNQLTPTVKLGDKFRKDEVLAYHPQYFHYSKTNGLRYSIGPLVKIAFASTYNTYEDAGFCTRKVGDQLKTAIVYREVAPLTKTANIISMKKIGDKVAVGDPLLEYQVVFDDAEIVKFINNLSSEEAKAKVEEETRTALKSKNAGKIVDIQIYTLRDPSDMTPSLAKVVRANFRHNITKKQLLERYDNTPGIVKAGYLMTDPTEPQADRYNRLRGFKDKDVVIEFYVEHEDVAGVGDKIAVYSANKNILSEVIQEGYEPYSEFHPEEEVSLITSPGTIARRMTPSVLPLAVAGKCMIELKRKIKDIIKYQ